MNLDSVADDLYGLTPDEFTSARTEYEKQAKGAGDRALAAAIHKLTRPSVSAWLANQLSRQHSGELSELLTLGEQLRAATSALHGSTLRELSKQRQQVVSALVQLVRRSATDSGQKVSDAAGRELEQTLHAALADPAAAEVLSAGRLTRVLASVGFGSLPIASSPNSVSNESAEIAAQPDSARIALRRDALVALDTANKNREVAAAELCRAKAVVTDASTEVENLASQLELARLALTAAREARKSSDMAVELANQAATMATQRLDALQ